MQFFYFNTKMYDLLGWTKKFNITAVHLLHKFCELEQVSNYNAKKKVNWDKTAYWFFISDKDLCEFSGINSRTTLATHLRTLIKHNLIETKQERSKNREGKATEYRIIKPIPLPDKVEFPQIYVNRYGLNWLEEIVENHKALILDTSAQKMSAQELNAESEKSKQPAFKNCAPSIDVELERKKERSNFEFDSHKEELSESQKKIIRLAKRYSAQAEMLIKPFLKELSSENEVLIIQVLQKNEEVNFEPNSGFAFLKSLFSEGEDETEKRLKNMNKIGAAEINKINQSGGFKKKEFSTYQEKKERQAKMDARRATSRDYYADLIAKTHGQSTKLRDFKELDEEIPEEELPF